MTLRVKWTIASGSSLLLLLALGGLSYRRLEQEAAAQQWLSHTHQVMERLDATLADALELDPSRTAANSPRALPAIARLEADIADVRTLTADNPRQQRATDRLTALVRARSALGTAA